jgi:endogenous inhibitor of DNA gyrase (YacG/DUF329 family)
MSARASAKVSCPTCGQPVTWSADSPWRPFCSRRCKLIDLGEWLDEGHRIPGEEVPDIPSGIDEHHH